MGFRGMANVALLCPHEPVNAYLTVTVGDTIHVRGFDGDEWADALQSFVGHMMSFFLGGETFGHLVCPLFLRVIRDFTRRPTIRTEH